MGASSILFFIVAIETTLSLGVQVHMTLAVGIVNRMSGVKGNAVLNIGQREDSIYTRKENDVRGFLRCTESKSLPSNGCL